MFKNNSLTNQKAFLLITALLVLTVLIVIGGALYMTIHSNLIQTRRDEDLLKSQLLARRLVNYAYTDASYKGWKWYTHKINTTTKILVYNDGANRPENPTNFPNITEFTGLSNNYRYKFKAGILPEGQTAEAVSYKEKYPQGQDWVDTGVLVIRAKANVNGTETALEYRVAKRSLYDYFFFYPEARTFNQLNLNGGLTQQLKPAGSIYVGGNLTLENANNFQNIKELAINGYLSYFDYQFSSPFDQDMAYGVLDGKAKLYQLPHPPYTYYMGESIYYSPDFHFNYNTNLNANPFEGTHGENPSYYARFWIDDSDPEVDFNIPRSLATGGTYPNWSPSNAVWGWDKYYGNRQANEQAVRFVIPEDAFAERGINIAGFPPVDNVYGDDWDNHWKQKHREYYAHYLNINGCRDSGSCDRQWPDASWPNKRPSDINQEWWDDLVFGNDRVLQGDNISVPYLDSEKNGDAWRNWMENHPQDLWDRIAGRPRYIKDLSTGNWRQDPLELEAEFAELAQENGIYVSYFAYTSQDIGRFLACYGCGPQPPCSPECQEFDFDRDGDVDDADLNIFVNLITSGERQRRSNPIENITQFKEFWNPVRTPLEGQTPKKTGYLEIDMDDLRDWIAINRPNFNGIIYIENTAGADTNKDFGVLIKNAQEIPGGGLTVVTPNNLFLFGGYNGIQRGNPCSGNNPCPPAAAISSQRIVYTLSNDFIGFYSHLAEAGSFPWQPYKPLNYPNHVENDTDPDWLDLGTGQSIQNFVSSGGVSGLNNISIRDRGGGDCEAGENCIATVTYLPGLPGEGQRDFNFTNTVAERQLLMGTLSNEASTWHTNTYGPSGENIIPNAAGDSSIGGGPDGNNNTVTYNTAMVSPYAGNDSEGNIAYALEQWSGKTREITGAFINLSDSEREWTANATRPGQIWMPGTYDYERERGWGPYVTSKGTWNFNYNTRFVEGIRPPGDFESASTATLRTFPPSLFLKVGQRAIQQLPE